MPEEKQTVVTGQLILSPMSANFLAHRMRFLGNAEVLADTFEFNQPADFDAESWAFIAQDLEQDLKAGKAIALSPPVIALLVESLEGNCLIGRSNSTQRAGLIALANLVATRLEPLIGRPVKPELN